MIRRTQSSSASPSSPQYSSAGSQGHSSRSSSGTRPSYTGAEGAVLFFEKVSPALEHVDSSSGAIGTAVNNTIDALVPIIADARICTGNYEISQR